MFKYFPLKLILILCPLMSCHADSTIWKGDVSATGALSPSIKLVLGKRYQINVSGVVNLGNWVKNGAALLNDACFEFSDSSDPHLAPCFKNSMNQTVCDGTYHPDHIYSSNQFIAAQSAIHFWIYDTNYEDNSGSFQVELIQVE